MTATRLGGFALRRRTKESGNIDCAARVHGGSMHLDLKSATGEYSAGWFNPRDGKYGEPFAIPGGAVRAFTAPDEQDWALSLRRVERD